MFKIYDLAFNPVALPVDQWGNGFKGLDINVSSVGQDVTEHTLPGVPGNIITGYRDNEREVSITVSLKKYEAKEFRKKRDEIYAFFKRLGTFYVAETQQEYKVLKVRVTDSFNLERPENVRTFATANIPLKIIGQPYWLSLFRSKQITEDLAFSLGIDASKAVYEHSNKTTFNIFNPGTVPLKTIQETDNCIITIDVKQSVTSFRIYDDTGRHFEYNPAKQASWALVSNNKIVLNGHYMTMNNTPIMDRTNRYFFNLLPEDNLFRVEGLSTYTINFDFRSRFY
ncbi:hypothetical protein GJU40_01505 [Bacillus lacus]|uniref:Siphovirus-type tail component RIFT-related domain-containing protein n=1 Tax=Metabacillus lacus TaxID=1983721 RepID=A0A7X2IWP2_9BACI|nr:phage tail domain-containing protein [Metabacillus lacus]MRX70842.1 hypothetical protein [Metabacillus lacus]